VKSQRFNCPVDGFQQMISGKYKLRLLWDLAEGPARNGVLKQRLSNTNGAKPVTARVLSRELKALAEMGLIQRKDYRTVPPKVEYSLTPLGLSLLPVIAQMHDWGVQHLVRVAVLRKMGLTA
jgi:DNA-binding HxlR family transcriptional regulator